MTIIVSCPNILVFLVWIYAFVLFITIYISACTNGDVAFFADIIDGRFGEIPKVFLEVEGDGRFWGICGNSFWNNNNGASIFCKKLGHESGVLIKTPGQSTDDFSSISVGQCEASDTDLTKCTGGSNNLDVEDYNACTVGSKYELLCIGGTNTKKSSCDGKS